MEVIANTAYNVGQTVLHHRGVDILLTKIKYIAIICTAEKQYEINYCIFAENDKTLIVPQIHLYPTMEMLMLKTTLSSEVVVSDIFNQIKNNK